MEEGGKNVRRVNSGEMYLEDRLLYQLCLVSSDRQVLELLGNHEGGLVPLKEPLLVQPEKDLVQLFVLMIQILF